MRPLNKIMLISLMTTCIAGCADFPFPGLYKMDVQQGNVISVDLVDQIHAGMSKDQVLAIMGSPVLTDVFNARQFDYVYTHEHRDYPISEQRVVIQFSDDRVTALSRVGV